MKNNFNSPIDFTKVATLVYHLPDGPSFSVEMDGLEELFDLEMEIGDVCDTSEIDGVVHFFPRGNARSPVVLPLFLPLPPLFFPSLMYYDAIIRNRPMR
jgi:hypothetical protein